jgi:hypothetical protein
MAVRVHQPGKHDVARGVDDLSGISLGNLGRTANRRDVAAFDRHGTGPEHAVAAIHGDHDAAAQNEGGAPRPLRCQRDDRQREQQHQSRS